MRLVNERYPGSINMRICLAGVCAMVVHVQGLHIYVSKGVLDSVTGKLCCEVLGGQSMRKRSRIVDIEIWGDWELGEMKMTKPVLLLLPHPRLRPLPRHLLRPALQV